LKHRWSSSLPWVFDWQTLCDQHSSLVNTSAPSAFCLPGETCHSRASSASHEPLQRMCAPFAEAVK
ncbi:mCG146138, partial [Mus musculus]